MSPTNSLQQVNLASNINPLVLRPNVPSHQRLEKWLPAYSLVSHLPDQLLQKQKHLALSSFAPSTLSTYGSGLAKFHVYCDTIAIPEINRTPCSTMLLEGFITFLSGTYSKTTIINFLAAVKAWNFVNFIPVDINEKYLQTLLRGAARVQPMPLPRRKPLTIKQMQRILQNLDITTNEQAAVATCLTTTFYACARLGEFTVRTVSEFSPKNHITINNVSFQHDRFFNKVTAFSIPRTKTTVTGEVVFWAKQNNATDPQLFFFNHLSLNEPGPKDHLFAFKTHSKKVPMTRNIFLRNIQLAAKKGNVEFTSGHSIRIGATLEYLLRGVPFEVVKQIGRWSSNAFTLYLREHGRILAPYLQDKPNINNEFLEYSNILLR